MPHDVLWNVVRVSAKTVFPDFPATQNSIPHTRLILGSGGPYTGLSCLPTDGIVPPNQRRDIPTIEEPRRPPERAIPRSLSRRQILDYSPQDALNDAQDCAGDQLTLIQNAAINARALAAAARDSQDNDLWTQYVA